MPYNTTILWTERALVKVHPGSSDRPVGRVLVVEHHPHGGPGRLLPALTARGFEIHTVRTHFGEQPPTSLSGYSAYVSMGGAMFVSDGAKYRFIGAEQELFRSAVQGGIPALGICLGAQILASGLGGTVSRDLPPRVGWSQVWFEGVDDPLARIMAPQQVLFEWHHESFGVPPGAEHLAGSEAFPVQAFRAGTAWGFQFHLEIERRHVWEWSAPETVQRELAELNLSRSELLRELDDRLPAQRRLADVVFGEFARLAGLHAEATRLDRSLSRRRGPKQRYDDDSMTTIRVNQNSGVPVYKQIVDQIEFMIEAGQMNDGDRLPSSRMLASNLRVNRNTVARAYQELRDTGYIESRRRLGMVVTGGREARQHAVAIGRARDVMSEAAMECVSLGLSPEEISSLAYHFSLHAEQQQVTLAFVECNPERSDYFAKELSEGVGLPVRPLVLGEFDPDEDLNVDLVLTTFFHLSEVRRLARKGSGDVVGIVVAPHVTTLVKLAQVPKRKRVGVLYSTKDQAVGIRDSLLQSGLKNIEVLEAPTKAELERVDVVVVPSEMPELRAAVDGAVDVIEFGNVLDESSMRMVREVIDELRDRKASSSYP